MATDVDKLKAETRVAGLFLMAAGYAQTSQRLPADVVRVLRWLLRGYP